MSGKIDHERSKLLEVGGNPVRHSLNQTRIRYEIEGSRRLFGSTNNKVQRAEAKREVKDQKRQVLRESINAAFEGNYTEGDIVVLVSYSKEFEKIVEENGDYSITIVDFTG